MKLYTDKSGGLNGKTCCRAGNELDTLDGVQLQWFVGARRDVAKFHETAVGPIVNVTPLRSGKAQVLSSEEIPSLHLSTGCFQLICMIADPNYSTMQPGILDIHITAPLHMEPDGLDSKWKNLTNLFKQAPTFCLEARLSWDFSRGLGGRRSQSLRSFRLQQRWQSMSLPAGR